MADFSIADLGQKLSLAGHLLLRPLCVHGSEDLPPDAVIASSVDRCVAKAMFMMASKDEVPAIYISSEDIGCCPGGLSWLGLIEMAPMIKYFVTLTPRYVGNG